MALSTRVLVLSEGKLALESSPHELATKLGLHRWMRIWVAPQHKENTLNVLNQQGFTFTPNGRSVYVQVNTGGKIAPLRSLEMASIPVEDFELLEGELVLKEEKHG
jgi:hypothetical protein